MSSVTGAVAILGQLYFVKLPLGPAATAESNFSLLPLTVSTPAGSDGRLTLRRRHRPHVAGLRPQLESTIIMPMTISVGTCSWTDPTLIKSGRFYPENLASSAEWRLRYYATVFPIVEVDSSYYAIPAPAAAQQWAERTPEGFVFNVKAFRAFTGHQTSPKVLHKDLQQTLGHDVKPLLYYRDFAPEMREELWLRFVDALAPLRAAGKLGLIHFQFPPWIVRNRAGHQHVEHCVERMAGHTVSVEFRHQSWFSGNATASTLAFERELGVVHTVVDAPQGAANSVPAVWEVTHPTYALLRMHGRNAATWNIKGATAASDRFNYDYSDAELAELAARLGRLAGLAPLTHALMNNNYEDQGQRNARSLIRELDQLKFAVQWPTPQPDLLDWAPTLRTRARRSSGDAP